MHARLYCIGAVCYTTLPKNMTKEEKQVHKRQKEAQALQVCVCVCVRSRARVCLCECVTTMAIDNWLHVCEREWMCVTASYMYNALPIG